MGLKQPWTILGRFVGQDEMRALLSAYTLGGVQGYRAKLAELAKSVERYRAGKAGVDAGSAPPRSSTTTSSSAPPPRPAASHYVCTHDPCANGAPKDAAGSEFHCQYDADCVGKGMGKCSKALRTCDGCDSDAECAATKVKDGCGHPFVCRPSCVTSGCPAY